MRKIRKLYMAIALAMAAMMLSATVAVAAVTLNSDGTGFVGKGDVQLAYGFNNKQLQDNEGKFQFRVNSVERLPGSVGITRT